MAEAKGQGHEVSLVVVWIESALPRYHLKWQRDNEGDSM